MQPHEQAQFLRAVGIFIQDQLQAAVAPMLEKINRLETELIRLKQEPEEKKLTEDDIVVLIDDAVNARNIKQAEIMIDTSSIISSMVAQAVEKIPVKDGKDADPVDYKQIGETIKTLLQDEIVKFSVTDGEDGKPGKDGKDGADVVAVFRDSDGQLVFTLSNGVTKSVGLIHGRDGEPGKDGRDGFGFDELSVEYDGERTLTLVFTKGEDIKRFPIKLPIPLDQGVWKPGDYEKGDGVTTGGSWFIAQKDTSAKPEVSKDWRLAVKRGDRGKDGEGKDGPPGKNGKDGRDLTQLGPDGSKWR